MSTKNTSKNYLSFIIASAIAVAGGYFLSLGANVLYLSKLNTVRLPLGDPTLLLGGLYFAIVVLVGALIAFFYEKFRCV